LFYQLNRKLGAKPFDAKASSENGLVG